MAVTFLEPGGDATFNVATTTAGGFWGAVTGSSIATDFVHGNHQKSIQFRPSTTDFIVTPDNIVSDTGGRLSIYVYFNVLPGAGCTIIQLQNGGSGNSNVQVQILNTGIIQLLDSNGTQIGTNGSTLSAGVWYRLCLAHTITSTTVNNFNLFVNGSFSISVTNTIIQNTGSSRYKIANNNGDGSLDWRMSDLYVDNSSSLTDTGNIWVTAKRPKDNGTTNGFTTQIGSGGSGYGSGHAPQVNERALSTTNGWSMVVTGSAITEEYTLENIAQGDISLVDNQIIDYMGWMYASSLSSETAKIIVANVQTNISLTSTNTMFTQIAGSTTYPSGNTDIGIVTATTSTTVSLYECGIIVAYIPSTAANDLLMMFR